MNHYLTLLSVSYGGGRLYALVPEDCYEALKRLKRDDPIRGRSDVYQHWWMRIDPRCHVRPRNCIKFWHK